MRTAIAPRARSIPTSVRMRIWREPCAVCGSPHNINVDHIVPVARGGTADPSNLQPLCHACNHIKGCRLSNAQVANVVLARGEGFFIAALFKHHTRYRNPYDGYSIDRWLADDPIQRQRASEMFQEFAARWRNA